MVHKNYHPAIKAAVNFWCDEISGDAMDEKLEIFRTTLSEQISKFFDLPEGVIEIFTKVPDKRAYTVFEKANKPSGILRAALKKAKLKSKILPQNISMVISTSRVEVCDGSADTRIIWKEILIKSSVIK